MVIIVVFMTAYFMILQRYTYHNQVGLFRAYYLLATGQRDKIAFSTGSTTRDTTLQLSKRSVKDTSVTQTLPTVSTGSTNSSLGTASVSVE